jgi:hypothetical protein
MKLLLTIVARLLPQNTEQPSLVEAPTFTGADAREAPRNNHTSTLHGGVLMREATKKPRLSDPIN